jgi:hypothetical protein
MKEFYRRANILLKIRRANPVDEKSEVSVYDGKLIVEKQIEKYFTEINRRPQHKSVAISEINFNVEEDKEI